MTAEIFRYTILAFWLLSSVGGLAFSTKHFSTARESWAPLLWKGTDEEAAARFHRLLARAFLIYFILVVATGLVALLYPAPPQPFRAGSAIATVSLIASNAVVVWGIALLRDYEASQLRLQEPHHTLEEIVTQLRTNDGSTLRDVADRLERAAEANVLAGKNLERLVIALGVKVDSATDELSASPVSPIDPKTARRRSTD